MASIRKRTWKTAAGELREVFQLDYRDQHGVRRHKQFARRKDAAAWQTTALHQVQQRTHVPESSAPTLENACQAWIRRGEADQRERSTLVQRCQHVELHILPLLGRDTKLSKIDVEAFRDELLRTQSRAMAKKVMTSLRGILKQAKLAHLAANVAPIETGGRHRKRLEVGRDIPTPAEIRGLIAAAAGYIRPLLAVAVFCGLRASELRGLRWQDVDFEDRRLHVRQRADKWNTVSVPKSEASYRSVAMSPFVVNTLKELRGDRIHPGEALVFANGAGNVESLANIWNRHLAPLQRTAGVVNKDGRAKYGLHAFRHFYASWRLEQGDNIKVVADHMGHGSPVITLTLYSHLMPQEDEHEKLAADERALIGLAT
jgi:integrase